jgi:hypothetical protein
MKTLKILFAAFIIAGFATSAMGQGEATESADATARVVALLEIAKNEDISWGDVALDTNPNIDPTDGTSSEAGLNATEITVGKFTIDGTEGASVIIEWGHTNLDGPGDDIVWTPALNYLASDGTNEDAENGGLEVLHGNDRLLGTGGIGMVFVGGGIVIADDQMPGTYEGDITVTVAYN